MAKENTCDRILVDKILELGGWANKWSDIAQSFMRGVAPKNPFDISIMLNGDAWAIENKFQKDYYAFNFNSMIKPHQTDNLETICLTSPDRGLFTLFIQENPRTFEVFTIHPDLVRHCESIGKTSITKKELLKLKEMGKTTRVYTRKFDFQAMMTNIIRELPR